MKLERVTFGTVTLLQRVLPSMRLDGLIQLLTCTIGHGSRPWSCENIYLGSNHFSAVHLAEW